VDFRNNILYNVYDVVSIMCERFKDSG
jgi:hypothetical protein